MTPAQLLVLAKTPVPGRVKTRLCPPYRPAEAAGLAAAALADTLCQVSRTPAARRLLVLDGSMPDPPPGFQLARQAAGPLGRRIVRAMTATAVPGISSVLVGMDTPQLTAALLTDVVRRLHEPGVDAVLGPSADGGWWCLGLRDPTDSAVIEPVPTSTPNTGELTRRALETYGLRVAGAPVLRDVDTAEDAAFVAAEAPGTRFAAAFAALGVFVSVPTSAERLYADGMQSVGSGRPTRLILRHENGRREPFRLDAWAAPHLPGDDGLLARCTGPTLDVGCGPGRLTVALGVRGVPTLGVDVAPAAVAAARHRGGLAMHRSLFDRLPGEGRWSHVLLSDGNVGIGGEPDRVLKRCGALLGPRRTALVEVEPRGGEHRHRVRLEWGERHSEWFAWASVGLDAIGSLAASAGLVARERWEEHGRCFVALEHA